MYTATTILYFTILYRGPVVADSPVAVSACGQLYGYTGLTHLMVVWYGTVVTVACGQF